MFGSTSVFAQLVLKADCKLLHIDTGKLMGGPVQRLICVILTCSYDTDVHTTRPKHIAFASRRCEIDHVH